jgi:hypothetical protein
VKESALRWSIFRPSALVTPEGGPEGTHGARHAPPGAGPIFGALRGVPGLSGFVDDVRPIPLDVLALAMLRVIEEPRDGAILEGRDLWVLGTRT